MKRGKKAGAPDAQTLVAAIRVAVKETPEGNPLTKRRFIAATRFEEKDICRHFARWRDAVSAAGFNIRHWNSPVSSDELLADWGRLVRALGRMPTNHEQKIQGNHSATTIMRRFGGWCKVPDAFREFASRTDGAGGEWNDVLALLPPKGADRKRRSGPPRIYAPLASQRGQRRPARLTGRPICGAPLDFAGLRHAPANELGVVFLFGAMARDLGFLVDSLQVEFPDCHAKRLIAPDTWQTVRIEFEFESRNFRTHGHDSTACDLIVCWEHNWPDCPESIEVIALNEHVGAARGKNPFESKLPGNYQ